MALESSAREKEIGSAFDNQNDNVNTPDAGSTGGSDSSGNGDSGSGSSENETPTIDVSDPAAPPTPENGGVAADAPTGTDPDDTINADPSESNAGINDPSVMNTLFNGTDASGNKVGSTTSKNGGDTMDEQKISGSAWVENDPEPTKPDIEVTEPTIDITDPPTEAPTDPPTEAPTDAPTEAPTEPEPTDPPTEAPTDAPTEAPTEPEEESTEPVTEPPTEPVIVDESDDPVIRTHAAMLNIHYGERGNTKYDFFQTCMNVLAYKFHFPVKNLVLACGGEDLLNELEEGGYHVPVYGDELMDDYLHDAKEQSVFTNALKMVFGDDTATDADREIADTELRHQAEDVEDGIAVSGDLDVAITQSEWGVDANSAAPMTAEDTGIQQNLVNSQFEQFDAHTYQDVKDSGNGLSDNAATVSGADYYEGNAGAENGGTEGNNGMTSTGEDGNPDYDRAPNDSAIEDVETVEGADTSKVATVAEYHNSEEDVLSNQSSSYEDSMAQLERLQQQVDTFSQQIDETKSSLVAAYGISAESLSEPVAVEEQSDLPETAEVMPDGIIFDAEYYAKMNPDVTQAVGNDFNRLFTHYVAFGAGEGRAAYEGDSGQTLPADYTEDIINEYKESFGSSCAEYAEEQAQRASERAAMVGVEDTESTDEYSAGLGE